jgi:hypothetical protein
VLARGHVMTTFPDTAPADMSVQQFVERAAFSARRP